MKESYETPEMELILLPKDTSVITDSNPDPNEGPCAPDIPGCQADY